MATKAKDTLNRNQVLELYFEGVEDPELHFTETLKAVGIKENQKTFGPENILAIANARYWINSEQATDYAQVADLYAKNKESLDPQHVIKLGEALAVTEANSEQVANSSTNSAGKSNQAMNPLVVPANRGFNAGEIAGLKTQEQINALDNVVANVTTAAYLKGFEKGMNNAVPSEGQVGNGLSPTELSRMADEVLNKLDGN